MQKKIYLIRHTKPQIEKGYIYGQTDLDVADTFEEEAQKVAELLPDKNQMLIYSSPLQRCYKLAKFLQGKQLEVDDRIKEINFGDWEMKRWDELDKQMMKNWLKDIVNQKAPGGESNLELYERVKAFWEDIQQVDAEEMGIVCHYGVILSLLSHLLDIPLQKAFHMDLNYGTVIRVIYFEGGRYKILFLK